MDVTDGYSLSADLASALALGCAVVPMVSALVLSVMSRFAYVRRSAMLTVAGTRIRRGSAVRGVKRALIMEVGKKMLMRGQDPS